MSVFNNRYDGYEKWSGDTLQSIGYIYCAPHYNNQVLKIKTDHIRNEGNHSFYFNASLTEFNKYINTYQFDYIYFSHKAFYDRLLSYRNIVETAKITLESFTSSREKGFDKHKKKKIIINKLYKIINLHHIIYVITHTFIYVYIDF